MGGFTSTSACLAIAAGASEASCASYTADSLHSSCMAATFAASCPTGNTLATLPDITTSGVVTCGVCGGTASADMDARVGYVWIGVSFGPLFNTAGVFKGSTSHVGGYHVVFTDANTRLMVAMTGVTVTTPDFGTVTSPSTCCTSDLYTGVVEGQMPPGAVAVSIIPYLGSKMLPYGTKLAIADGTVGSRMMYTGSVAFSMASGSLGDAFKMLVSKAIVASLPFVADWKSVSITGVTSSTAATTTTTTTTSTTTTAGGGGRRLSSTVTVSYKLLLPVGTTPTAPTAAMAAALKSSIESLATSAGVSLPTITGTPTIATLSAGELYFGSGATSIASLALTPFIVVALAFLW